MVAMLVLEASAEMRESSSLSLPTKHSPLHMEYNRTSYMQSTDPDFESSVAK